MNGVTGKVAIVTGAGAGIGAAIARLLAHRGAQVSLADIDLEACVAVAAAINAETPDRAEAIRLDVSNEAEWQQLIDGVIARHGRLDVLVNNAGIQMSQALEDISLADWRKVFSVNADGAFLGTRMAITQMKTGRGGSIVNVSSTFAMVADGLNAHYCASKAAMTHFTKAAALYCADRAYGIRVNSVHPGVIQTPMLEREIYDVASSRGDGETSAVKAEWAKLTPLGIGTALDIAHGVLYLASDASGYVTGSELVIDGGHIIR